MGDDRIGRSPFRAIDHRFMAFMIGSMDQDRMDCPFSIYHRMAPEPFDAIGVVPSTTWLF